MRKLAPASERLVERGKRVLALEAAAVRQLADNLDVAFARAVEILAAAKGRVIVSGVGKSGLRPGQSTKAPRGTHHRAHG